MADNRVNCFECQHHFITHDPARPYGCRKFGFKGQFLPSRTVFETTGMKCAYHQAKGLQRRSQSSTGMNGRQA
jgi:hypothetical protein